MLLRARICRVFGLVVVAASAIAFQQVTVAITTAESLNVRQTPGGEVVDRLPRGTRVAVLQTQRQWAQVLYTGSPDTSEMKRGWVSSRYLFLMGDTGLGSTCETEHRSGAEVCVEVTDTDLDCEESYSGDYYSDCEVQVEYDVTTDYQGQTGISVEVECEAAVSYEARGSYDSSESEDDYYSHTLYANGSDYGSFELDFSFLAYKEVYSVDLESAECSIQDLRLQ